MMLLQSSANKWRSPVAIIFSKAVILLLVWSIFMLSACTGSKKANTYTPPPTPSTENTVHPTKPIAKKSAAYMRLAKDADLALKAQTLLYLQGYNAGKINGLLTLEFDKALEQYKKAHNLTTDADALDKLGLPYMRFAIEDLQQTLLNKGYDPGPIDGLMGPMTKQAYLEFVQQHNFSGPGINLSLLNALFNNDGAFLNKNTPDPLFNPVAQATTEKQSKTLTPASAPPLYIGTPSDVYLGDVQRALLSLGYDPGPPTNNKLSPQLEDALFRFQLDHKLPLGGTNPETLRALGF